MAYPALEAFTKQNSVIELTAASPELIKEVQSLLNLQTDGIAGQKTLTAFAKFKADRNQGNPSQLGSGSAKLLLELAAKPVKAVSHSVTNPAVQRQIERLSAYLAGEALNLDIPCKYFSQRDNFTMPHRTCNSSTHAMYCDWLLRVIGKFGLETDDGYLRKIIKNGTDTIYHEAHTAVIKEYGFSTKWNTDRDWAFVMALLDAGFPVPCNILHRGTRKAPKGGHIIMLVGRKDGVLLAHDPYGTLASGYSATNGKHSQISESEFRDRWQGGYRVLA
jgi:hypothetical protein